MKPKFSPGRCDYCQKPAVASMTWWSFYSSMGHRKSMAVHARTCAEHEGCVNWEAMKALRGAQGVPVLRVA